MNAVSIVPSSPINFPGTSRKSATAARIELSPIFIFVSSHKSNPAGAATIQALPRTKIVLSSSERSKTFKICGRLYGGSSSVNADGTPFKIVTDKSFEIKRVSATPDKINNVRYKAESNEPPVPEAKNAVITAISVPNLPLHGTNEFVSIAISLSLGECIIRQPVTPAALHPKPMHMGICWANVLLRSLCNQRGVTLLCECQEHMIVGIADCSSQSRLNAIFFACFFSNKTIVNFDGLMFDFSMVCLFIISLTNFNTVNEFE